MAFMSIDRDVAVANMLLGSWRTACFEHHADKGEDKFKQHNFTETAAEPTGITCFDLLLG